MAYFRVYTISFQDSHNIHPANWRIDILDDQASSNILPISLIPSKEAPPLIIQRINTSDDKATRIIGSQISLSYEYTGSMGEPIPELFGGSDERRFRAEVYKNESIYGIWYVKPDYIQYEDKYPPFTVTITAVDGLSFIKGQDWNAYDNAGPLSYEIMSLYEIIMERGLLQVLDNDTAINVINTLRPENITGDESLLNDLFVHSDQFIDFTKGPDSIYDAIDKHLISFYSRLFIAQNQVWMQRIPDLNQASITAENYINGILNPLPVPTIFRTIGPDVSANDATPIDKFGINETFPAIKRVEYTLTYKGINRLLNFDWRQYTSGNFLSWQPSAGAINPSQKGSGTQADPYLANLPFTTDPFPISDYLLQDSTINNAIINAGDIIEITIPYSWTNTSAFRLIIALRSSNPSDPLNFLSDDGSWFQNPDGTDGILINRSGRKRNGNYNLKSLPAPSNIGTNAYFLFRLYYPDKKTYHIPAEDGDFKDDPLSSDTLDIYPIKMGVSSISSAGRNITDINNERVSQVKDRVPYYFIDTGEKNISNTIFVDNGITPAINWSPVGSSDKQDIEKHMADSNIDQYARCVPGWQGSLYSNTIDFWHIFIMANKPGKKFILMNDKYDVQICTHDVSLQEILPENSASTIYSEYDIEDSTN